MSRPITEELTELITLAEAGLKSDGPPSPDLLSKLENVRDLIENLFEDWEAPPETLAYAVDELDENFELAAEEFVRACDATEEAALNRDPEFLDEAKRSIRKGRLILRAARLEAQEKFESWAVRGELGSTNS